MAIIKIVAWPVAVPTVHYLQWAFSRQETNEVSIGYDRDNRIHWILRRRIKSFLRSEVSDGYRKEYSNRRVLRHKENPNGKWREEGRSLPLLLMPLLAMSSKQRMDSKPEAHACHSSPFIANENKVI